MKKIAFGDAAKSVVSDENTLISMLLVTKEEIKSKVEDIALSFPKPAGIKDCTVNTVLADPVNMLEAKAEAINILIRENNSDIFRFAANGVQFPPLKNVFEQIKGNIKPPSVLEFTKNKCAVSNECIVSGVIKNRAARQIRKEARAYEYK